MRAGWAPAGSRVVWRLAGWLAAGAEGAGPAPAPSEGALPLPVTLRDQSSAEGLVWPGPARSCGQARCAPRDGAAPGALLHRQPAVSTKPPASPLAGGILFQEGSSSRAPPGRPGGSPSSPRSLSHPLPGLSVPGSSPGSSPGRGASGGFLPRGRPRWQPPCRSNGDWRLRRRHTGRCTGNHAVAGWLLAMLQFLKTQLHFFFF